jgi:hypothetical protein
VRRPREAVDRCVEQASRDRATCHRDCEDEFAGTFLDCYGPPSACTTRCQAEQTQCQDPPFRALRACEGDPGEPRSCRARVDAERAACRTAPDPRACDDAARARGFECWQACQRAQEPALQRCAARFRACLDGCVGGG